MKNAKISTKDNKSEFEIASTLQSLLKIDSNETDEIDIIISSVVPNKTRAGITINAGNSIQNQPQL